MRHALALLTLSLLASCGGSAFDGPNDEPDVAGPVTPPERPCTIVLWNEGWDRPVIVPCTSSGPRIRMRLADLQAAQARAERE